MKTFTFRFAPDEPSVGTRIKKALKGERYVRPDELVSRNLAVLLQMATQTRLEIFYMIVKNKPHSIYELSEKLEKSQPYILKEVKILEGLGLITLKKELDGNRERLRPVALYSNIIFDFQFDKEFGGKKEKEVS